MQFIHHRYHLSLTLAALENALTGIGFMIGGPLCGYLSRYFGNLRIMMAGALFQVVIMMAAHYLLLPLWLESICFFSAGITSGSVILCFNVLREEVPANIYGVASGLINMFFGSFSIFVSPLIGHLYAISSKNIEVAIFPIIICSVLAILFCFTLMLKKGKVSIS